MSQDDEAARFYDDPANLEPAGPGVQCPHGFGTSCARRSPVAAMIELVKRLAADDGMTGETSE